MRARDNPFAVDRLHALAFRGASPAVLLSLARARGRGAVVGPEGSGKTTLLLEIAALVEHPTWIQLRRDARALTAEHRGMIDAATDVVFVDGADLLPLLDRRWLAKHTRARTVLGTLHTAGWLPTLAQLSTSPALLDELVRELTGASLAARQIDRDALYRRHAGNLRAALRDLYDRA